MPPRSLVRLVRLVLTATYLFLLATPSVNMIWRVFEDSRLAGVIVESRRPALETKTFVREHFQGEFVAWYEAHYGARGLSVKLDNSLEYYVFSETPPESTVLVGYGETLFSKTDDVEYFNRRNTVSGDEVRAAARRLERVQAILGRKGKVLVPIIVPSKTTVYPEKIPPMWRRNLPSPRPGDVTYAMFVAELDRLGVRYVDGRKLLHEADDGRPASVFLRTGRHWSHPSACQVLEEAFRIARPKLAPDHELPVLDCGYTMSDAEDIARDDYDLFRLLNVWIPKRVPIPIPVMHATPDVGDPSRRPRVLFVGSSYCWTLIVNAERNHAFGRTHYYYYNSLLYDRDAPTVTGKVEPTTPTWKETTLSKDLYLLDMAEIWLPGNSHDFLDQFEAALAD